MENLHIILSIGATALGLLFSTILFVYKFNFARKESATHEQHLTVRDALLGFIADAERFVNMSGEQKKAYVLEKVGEFMAQNGMNVAPETISQTIDQIIALTKSVNV